MNIREQIEANKADLVLKEFGNGLRVLKYRRHVFYDATWNEFLRECRGLVIDQDYNVVTLPFKKIHNYGIEADAPEFAYTEMVFASRKVNGFMIAVTWYNNDLLWSTTGSIDSAFVGYAKEIYEQQINDGEFRTRIKANPTETFLFECVHPIDPHIVPEEAGLYFLGSRAHDFSSKVELMMASAEEVYWKSTGVKIVETQFIEHGKLMEQLKTVQHEGFVFESMDGLRVSKCKSPHYLAKKFLMRGNWQKFCNAKNRFELAEEFYPVYSHIREVEGDRFFEMDEIARREWIEHFFWIQVK